MRVLFQPMLVVSLSIILKGLGIYLEWEIKTLIFDTSFLTPRESSYLFSQSVKCQKISPDDSLDTVHRKNGLIFGTSINVI